MTTRRSVLVVSAALVATIVVCLTAAWGVGEVVYRATDTATIREQILEAYRQLEREAGTGVAECRVVRGLLRRESILPLGLRDDREETPHRSFDITARLIGVIHYCSSSIDVPAPDGWTNPTGEGNLTQSRRSNR